jgi:DNA-binding PadR family transcriptional regulator
MGVQDVVLARIVERPDYGYRIVQRLEEEGSSISPAAVYKALGRLREKGSIEPTDADEPDARSRKHYRATPHGTEEHAARLARTIQDLPGRLELLGRLENTPADSADAVIDEYERHVLAEIGSEPPAHLGGLVGKLAAQERELVNEARLRWISIARRAIGDGSTSV